MNPCSGVRSSRPARLFSFGLLNALQVRLRRPYVRAALAGFPLERLAIGIHEESGSGCPVVVRGWQVRIVGEMAPACQPQQQGEAHGERDEDKGNASQNPVGGSVRGRDRGGEEPGVSSWHL
jgi:hypothetical protein